MNFIFLYLFFYRINNHVIKFNGLILYIIEKQDMTTQKMLQTICLVITRDYAIDFLLARICKSILHFALQFKLFNTVIMGM